MIEHVELPAGVFENFVAASVNLDLDILRSCISDDITWFSGGPGWMVQGAEDVLAVRAREWENPNARVESARWLMGPFGERRGDLLCAWGIVQLEIHTDDPPRSGTMDKRACLVLRKEEGQWRILMDSWSRPRVDEYETYHDEDPRQVRYYDYVPVAAPM